MGVTRVGTRGGDRVSLFSVLKRSCLLSARPSQALYPQGKAQGVKQGLISPRLPRVCCGVLECACARHVRPASSTIAVIDGHQAARVWAVKDMIGAALVNGSNWDAMACSEKLRMGI